MAEKKTAPVSLKEAILAAEDIGHEDVEIPEWGGITVRMRGMSSAQADAYQAKRMAMRFKAQQTGDVGAMEVALNDHRAELVAKCMVDPETGRRIFSDSEAKSLAGKNAGIVKGLFVLVEHLSGMSRTFGQKVKEAEGNSSDGQS